MKKENKKKGYIYLWKSCEWMIGNPPLLALWVYILFHAAHERTNIKQIKGNQINDVQLEPGQMLYGHDFVAKKIGVKKGKIRSLFSALKSASMLTSNPAPRGQLVTVTNWAYYQGGGIFLAPNSAPNPAPNPAPYNKEIKKLNNINKKSNRYSPKTTGPIFESDEERDEYYGTGENNEN